MRIRNLWFVVLLLLCITPIMLKAQSYDKLWKEVEKAEKNGLPKSAIKYAENIFRKAETEKNSGQMLKAYTARTAYRQQIDPDSFYVDLKGLEQWAHTTSIHEDCAVLHTLIARLYSDYAYQNQWSLMRRTDVVDTLPDDMREWGSNVFMQKVLDHTHAALEDSVALFGMSSKEYIPFVDQHSTSRYFNHNMYQLLAFYAISSLRSMATFENDSILTQTISNIYSSLNRMYRKQNNNDALILLALEGLEWRKTDGGLSSDGYLRSLDELIKTYDDREVCAEVYLAKARQLTNDNKKVEAYQVCQDGIQRYPKYPRVNALKRLQEEILRPELSITTDTAVYPGDTLSLNVTHANLNGFTVHYYKVNLPATSPVLQKPIDDDFYKRYTQRIHSKHIDLARPSDYFQKDTVYKLTTPEEGIYAVQIVPDANSSQKVSQLLTVTRLKLLSRSLAKKEFEAIVVDARSGQPVNDATIHMFVSDKGDLKLDNSYKTDENGRVTFPWNNDYMFITAEEGNGSFILPQRVYGGYYSFSDGKRTETQNLRMLTDRSLYRPGQTVYVKGIAYSQLSDTANVVSGKSFTLTLLDANYREISKKDVRTNEFGSFTTDFTLPSGGLNGNYTLRANEGGSVNIRVEEYKRPTFEVNIPDQERTYKLNDSIKVKGTVRTYSGVPVQELPVQYTVTRKLFGWWGRYYGVDTTIDSGTVQLNDKGEFTLPVILKGGDKTDSDQGFYIFTVAATVTNIAGETQTSSARFTVGKRSLLLSTNAPDRINKDDDIKITFSATNLSSKPVSVKGEYKLYRFTDYAANKLVKDPTYTGTFTSNEEMLLTEWKSLPSGAYRLILTANDEQGREATNETGIILFSINDKRPAEYFSVWYYPINLEFDRSHPGEFIFGTSEKDAHIFMDVFSGNKRLESRLLHLSDSVMRFTYPYKEEYEDGLKITFCFVKDGKPNMQNVTLRKRLPEKELQLSWSVFRDKLRPGQQEEWKLTIKNPDGSFANAELLATMYDASLDKIWKRPQYLNVNYSFSIPSTDWWFYRTNRNYYGFWFDVKSFNYPALMYDAFWMMPSGMSLNESLVVQESVVVGYGTTRQSSATGGIMMKGDMAYDSSVIAQENGIAAKPRLSLAEESDDQQLPEATENLRTNFAETAFFYPQLRTNEKGEVVIAFTMPESLTRWNFNGYAHTKGMLTGMINSEVVTSKEFMLTPNLPRFVRVGDKTAVAASVANLTGKALSGNVIFTLFDPLTEKVIATQKQKFSAEAGKTVGVNFMFTATDAYDLLGCRLVAEGGSFSDGEQHLLPVLSNKERIIETVAMPIRGNQTREFSLESLFNNNSKTATDRSLTVEFSGNPAWYAVQALPSLSLPANDNAISWATAYYANSLASYIMNSQPRLKAVFDAWKQQGGTKETFMSNLQKNQDVKAILLEESPWVMEATTEQEQKQRIATLFDLNNIQNNNITALNKLKELQLSNGAWTWYKGMTGNRYITNYVTQLLARLTMLTNQPLDSEMVSMRNSALIFLHQEAQIEYEQIRRNEKNDTQAKGISGSALQYLYLIAISGEQVPTTYKTAYNYFLNKVKETIATQSITEKALGAVIMQKAGRTSDAEAFTNSLKEYTTQTDEQGMFFAFNENPYSWSGLKVPAHVTVMEAFDVVNNNKSAFEEMKLWLLKQKQTQQWNSPVATANAVYALLYRGTNLTESQGDVRITLAGKVLETLAPGVSSIPGMAYIKETITDKSTITKAKKAVVEKRDEGIAWGAVYAQYQEDIDKVTSYGEGLNVDKKLYVEKITGNKKELLAITSGDQLKVGDKVVSRITIKLDRAMDFVQLKDQRGACLEPINNLSGYTWGAETGYYVAVKDASTNFYFDSLGKGVYVLEHSYRVSRKGTYEGGLAVMQSAYAPEYTSHSASVKLNIE